MARHDGLVSKLYHYGVQDGALARLKAYLTNRSQRVRLGQAFSSWQSVPAGVPQGSVLGPLLFIAYTADLPTVLSDPFTQCYLFADDTSLTRSCPTAGDTEQALQVSIDGAATG